MYEFDGRRGAVQKFSTNPKIDAVNGVYVMDAAEKLRLEEKQIELYNGGELADNLGSLPNDFSRRGER